MLKQPHFYLKSFCCVCSKYNNLLDLNSYDYDEITYKTKLSISFPDLECTNDNNEIPSYICMSCSENLDEVYKFRMMFLHTRKYTLCYMKELKNVPNNTYNKLHVDILDIKTLLPPDITKSLSSKSVKLDDTVIEDENLDECNQYLNVYKEFAREDRPDKLTEIGTNFLGFSPINNNCRTCKGLKKHNQKKEQKPHFTCQICRKSYSRDGWLKKHQLSHGLPKKLKCKICLQLILAKEMADHKKKHEIDECFSCGSQLQLGEHHVCKPLEKCVNCNQILREEKHLCKDFKCVLCPRVFKNKQNLTFHIKCHLSVKRYKCSHCGDKFDKRNSLVTHLAAEH